MVLPFVRVLLADLEHSEAFERVRRHLSGGTGRRRVSGLTATARALYLPYFVRAAAAPSVIIVPDNKAAEALHAAVLAACELTGALPAESVLRLPAHDVLPFENLSPHSEIQETRAATLWKISHPSSSPRLIIAPVEAACMKLFSRDYYRALALHLRVGEEHIPDMLVEHLLSVGYTRVDVVEMPGQVTIRGGIIDVYSPEQDRPVRIDFFGDEIESIRKFDPETQRSSSPLDDALLLPLTETPSPKSCCLRSTPASPAQVQLERRLRGAKNLSSSKPTLPPAPAKLQSSLGGSFLRLLPGRIRPCLTCSVLRRVSSSKSLRWSRIRGSAGGIKLSNDMIAPASAISSARKISISLPGTSTTGSGVSLAANSISSAQ